MKLKISKTVKIFLLVVCSIFIAVTAIYLFLYCNTPRFIEEKHTTYAYKGKSDVSYQVFLVPNILYEEQSIEEGKIYITEFIDYINTSFRYQLDGDQTADINGSYQIIASVEGYTGTKDQYKTIWERKYTVLPSTAFSVQDKRFSIEKNVSLNLKNYIGIAEEIMKQSKVSTSAKLRVEMTVNFKLSSGINSVEKVASPAIEIPLDAGYFTVSEIGVQEEPGKIEETKQVPLGSDKMIILLCSLTMGILVIFISYLLFFTVEPTENDLYKKSLNKILKMHGSRLVALNSEIVDTIQNYCKVKSMDDLIRIADEISKPVMYEFNANVMEISQFYVFDQTRVYVFELQRPYNPEKNIEEESDAAPALYHF